MQAADTPDVEAAIQKALENESATKLELFPHDEVEEDHPRPLTVNDARRIIAGLENPRFDTLEISYYSFHDPAVLNIFRDGLPLCPSITTVILYETHLENEDLDRLRPAFYNTSVKKLDISNNYDHMHRIQGRRGGEVLRDLLVGNDTLRELIWSYNNRICPEVAIGFGQGLTSDNHGLQILNLESCHLGNDFLTNLLLADGMINNYLTNLYLHDNDIEGAEGGQQVSLLLKRFPALKVFKLDHNNLGPLGASALAPGLAAARHLETLNLGGCGLGNDGMANLIPDGQENRSLTDLHLSNNSIEGEDSGRQVSLLMLLRCPLLKVLKLDYNDSLGPLGARALAPGLAAATCQLEELWLWGCRLGNDGVANLILPDGQVNRSLTNLHLADNDIQGADGGRQLCLLLQRFPALKVLDLYDNNRLGPLGARALAPGLAAARHLESLNLKYCYLGSVANLIPDGQENRSLTNLNLGNTGLEGEHSGRQVSLLLQGFTSLKVLDLDGNEHLGTLAARALAPGLAAASQLESLGIVNCWLGNDVANLVPDGQVSRSLINLNIRDNNIQGTVGGENVIALASRCTNLDRLDVNDYVLSPDQRHRLDMLLDQNRLCKEASALGGSTFPILFRFVENARRHEHGLSAIFVILQNDGDDYFCTALNRAME